MATRIHERAGRGRLVASIALLIAALAGGTAAAQGSADHWPSRPIRLIVPFAAGGGNDTVARLIQRDLEKALGQPLVIENKPAGSGIVGTERVAKAAPDGYLLLMAFTTHTVNPAVTAKLPYDTERDLAPVVLVGKSPLLFSVNPKVPARTLGEFVTLAKANPDKFNYGTPGAPSQAHLLISLWSRLAGIRMQHIAYRGAAPALFGAAAGEVQSTLISALSSLPHVNSGTLRALATGGREREAHLPDVPTFEESGYPGFEAVAWAGLFTRAGTPPAIIGRLNAEVNRIISTPMLAKRFDEEGMVPAGGSPEEFGAFVSRELARWKEAARTAGISAE
jgi:tripartite-type tricarboxylate transporter receptor subunit TctC